MSYPYEGFNRNGTSVIGTTSGPVAQFVESKFRAGWKDLIVSDGPNGEHVGGISPHGGHRVWWADEAVDNDPYDGVKR